MLRKLALAPTLVLSLFALPAYAATPLPTLTAVEKALESGASVSVALNFGLCKPAEGTKATQTKGGLRLSAYRITSDGTLAFSDDHFTVANDDQKPIRQFIRYQVRPDNSAQITIFMFDLPSLKQRGTTLTYNCALNQGLSFNSQ
jgi:hypothetical protein